MCPDHLPLSMVAYGMCRAGWRAPPQYPAVIPIPARRMGRCCSDCQTVLFDYPDASAGACSTAMHVKRRPPVWPCTSMAFLDCAGALRLHRSGFCGACRRRRRARLCCGAAVAGRGRRGRGWRPAGSAGRWGRVEHGAQVVEGAHSCDGGPGVVVEGRGWWWHDVQRPAMQVVTCIELLPILFLPCCRFRFRFCCCCGFCCFLLLLLLPTPPMPSPLSAASGHLGEALEALALPLHSDPSALEGAGAGCGPDAAHDG